MNEKDYQKVIDAMHDEKDPVAREMLMGALAFQMVRDSIKEAKGPGSHRREGS